jgi:hypothetical protein
MELCIIIESSGSAISTKFGGEFCNSGSSGFSTQPEPSKAQESKPTSSPHGSATLKFTLRSEDDPAVCAEDITGGSMSFGATTAEMLEISFIVLALGACFCIPWCAAAYFLCFRKEKQQQQSPGPYQPIAAQQQQGGAYYGAPQQQQQPQQGVAYYGAPPPVQAAPVQATPVQQNYPNATVVPASGSAYIQQQPPPSYAGQGQAYYQPTAPYQK